MAARYHYLVRHPKAFVQQVAHLIRYGYVFWVSGRIPDGKDPFAVDRKLISKYQIAVSRGTRILQKKTGTARVRYLRCGRFFLLMATHGHSAFFQEEKGQIRHFKSHPLKFHGHSVSFRNGHPHVRIEMQVYKRMKARYGELATRRRLDWWRRRFWCFPFEPWAPVRRQAFALMRYVSKTRQTAGLDPIDWRVSYRMKRRSFQVFPDSC